MSRSSGDPWTYDERLELAQVYLAGGVAAACSAFPSRSKAAISVQLSNWGIAASKYIHVAGIEWTKDEDWVLYRSWDHRLSDEQNLAFVRLLFPRSDAEIKQRVDLRNIHRKRNEPVVYNAPLPVEETDVAIRAWRIWEVRSAGRFAFLESCATRTVWPAGEPLVAHKIYDFEDHTGIHAFNRPRTPKEYLADYSVDGSKVKNLVRGTVWLWGIVIEHEHGYRAQYAYPDILVVQDDTIGQALRRTYGCEVITKPWSDVRAALAASIK